jgi:hypothetical protein
LEKFDTLSAQLIGDRLPANRAIFFTTRDSAIARITQQFGLSAELKGMSHGLATVVGRAVADTLLADSSQVTVGTCESPPPTVSITAITVSGTTTRVDTANVSGRIDIRFAVDQMPSNTVPRLRVGAGAGPMLDCPPLASGARTGVCTLDTAAKDGQGALRYANGPQAVSVRMVRPDGVIVALTQRILVFNNMT